MYKIDMHVHTSKVSSCAHVSADTLVYLYKDAGYDAIVITDHYYDRYFDKLNGLSWEEKVDRYLEGYYEAFNTGSKIGLNVIPGMEIKFIDNQNDYLVYGIDADFLKENKELFSLGLSKFRKLISDKDMLIYQAHPFRDGMTVTNPSLLDGVEVFNGNPRHNSRNQIAIEFARMSQLKMLSGSDFHQVVDLARGGIVTSEKVTTSNDLMTILKENNYTLIEN